MGRMARMKWTRASQHVEALATACEAARALPLPVTRLSVFGPFLAATQDLAAVDVAIEVDLPEVPWRSVPQGAAHWANATKLSRNPFSPVWRSAQAPVWNHFVVRPVPVWTVSDGVLTDTLAAIQDGTVARPDAPGPGELRDRIEAELAVSLAALRSCTRAYEEKRWRPGKLEPVADALWSVTDGYLDLLDARQASASSSQS